MAILHDRRLFVRLSHAMAPFIRRGIIRGNRWSGSLLVLRTRGRRSGRWREAALDFAPAPEGNGVLVAAGWGDATQWYRNLLADPRVEVAIGGRVRRGRASVIEDSTERRLALRAVLLASGLAGRSGGIDPRSDTDERLAVTYGEVPIVRIAFEDAVPRAVAAP